MRSPSARRRAPFPDRMRSLGFPHIRRRQRGRMLGHRFRPIPLRATTRSGGHVARSPRLRRATPLFGTFRLNRLCASLARTNCAPWDSLRTDRPHAVGRRVGHAAARSRVPRPDRIRSPGFPRILPHRRDARSPPGTDGLPHPLPGAELEDAPDIAALVDTCGLQVFIGLADFLMRRSRFQDQCPRFAHRGKDIPNETALGRRQGFPIK